MLKFGTHILNSMSITFLMLSMTHVIHVSDQEPSMSSKSRMIRGFLTHFQSCQKAEIWHTGRESNGKNNYELHNDQCPPCLQSRTLNVLQVIDDDGGALDTLLIILEIQEMFGDTYDHKLFGKWAEGPSGGPQAYLSPLQELE